MMTSVCFVLTVRRWHRAHTNPVFAQFTAKVTNKKSNTGLFSMTNNTASKTFPPHLFYPHGPYMYVAHISTRSQAVTRISDRTASQHLLGSRDVIGHVTI